jgi:hypothetical protein
VSISDSIEKPKALEPSWLRVDALSAEVGLSGAFWAHEEPGDATPQMSSKASLRNTRLVIFGAKLLTITMMSISPFVAEVSDLWSSGKNKHKAINLFLFVLLHRQGVLE